MLDKLFAFTRMLSELREVKRMTKYTTSDIYENDSEHSYQLAMVCRYILEQHPEYDYNLDKVLKYALVHDMVEVYAGDTIPFHNPEAMHVHTDQQFTKESKLQREHDALVRLKSEFPEVSDIRSRIEWYEEKNDKESKFVYAIDKLIPELSIIPDQGKNRQEHKLNMEELLAHKDKALIDPLASELHAEITDIIKQHPEWFPR